MGKRTHRGWLAAGVLLAIFVSFNCTTTSDNVRQASEYFKVGDYDKAVEILQWEQTNNPTNQEIKLQLFRAKLNSYLYHLGLAREKFQADEKEAATRQYQLALNIFPDNIHLKEEMEQNLTGKKGRQDETAKPTILPPISLDIRKDETVTLNLKNVQVTNIFKSLGKSFNVNFIFDKDFRDFLHSVEIENKTFNEILKMLCLVANAQFRILDRNSVLIYQDQFAKKQLFDLKGIKTFYLSNIRAEDAKKLLMSMFTTTGQQVLIQEEPNLNALIVRADFNTLTEIERFLPNIDLEKNEVEINIEILEVNRNVIHNLGTDYGSGIFNLQAATQPPDATTTNPPVNLKDLGSTNFYLTIPSVAINLLESNEHDKIIAKPNLRGLDGEEISFMVGDEVPIPETQYSAIAAGGINTVPLTTYRYKNVGVEIKLTPYIHPSNEVTLKMKMTMNFLTGSSVGTQFPIIGKREIESKIRLKEGETNIIGGFIRDDIRRSLAGLPGVAKIPLLGKLFGNSKKTISQTDLIFAITPRILRKIPVRKTNLETIWSNVDQPPPALPAAIEPRLPGERRLTGDPRDPDKPQRNSISISPAQNQVPANAEAVFSIQIQSETGVASLSLKGSLSGGSCEIAEVKTEFFDESVKTFKNVAGNSFDVGLSFTDASKPLTDSPLVQLKVKFLTKGKYTLTVDNITAYDPHRNRIEISPAMSQIDVI